MILQEVDDRLSSPLLDRALDGVEWVFWIGHLQAVAVLVELSLGHAEDVGVAAVQSNNITIAPIPQAQLRVCFFEQLRES